MLVSADKVLLPVCCFSPRRSTIKTSPHRQSCESRHQYVGNHQIPQRKRRNTARPEVCKSFTFMSSAASHDTMEPSARVSIHACMMDVHRQKAIILGAILKCQGIKHETLFTKGFPCVLKLHVEFLVGRHSWRLLSLTEFQRLQTRFPVKEWNITTRGSKSKQLPKVGGQEKPLIRRPSTCNRFE